LSTSESVHFVHFQLSIHLPYCYLSTCVVQPPVFTLRSVSWLINMIIPKERPANADNTLTASCIAVTVSACILVIFSVILRYLGRWVLQKRQEVRKRSTMGRIYGLDDGEWITSSATTNVANVVSFQRVIPTDLLRPCDGGFCCYTERNGRPLPGDLIRGGSQGNYRL